MQASSESRWSLLPEPATPLPWKRKDSICRSRVAVFLKGAGKLGATAKQIAASVNLTERQVIVACWSLRQEHRVIVLDRKVPGHPRPQGGGRQQKVFAWRADVGSSLVPAYRAGALAYERGLGLWANPAAEAGSDEAMHWAQGWHDAKEARPQT
jgi:hypothetical protein